MIRTAAAALALLLLPAAAAAQSQQSLQIRNATGYSLEVPAEASAEGGAVWSGPAASLPPGQTGSFAFTDPTGGSPGRIGLAIPMLGGPAGGAPATLVLTLDFPPGEGDATAALDYESGLSDAADLTERIPVAIFPLQQEAPGTWLLDLEVLQEWIDANDPG